SYLNQWKTLSKAARAELITQGVDAFSFMTPHMSTLNSGLQKISQQLENSAQKAKASRSGHSPTEGHTDDSTTTRQSVHVLDQGAVSRPDL
ncbi:hypothetical protein NL487_26705, partial [Klebsiella pneumoniae]|nr:hypothetical protein [Klebsiella pneumoniae]